MKLPNNYGTVSKMKGNLRNPWRVMAPDNGRKTIGYTKTKAEGMLLLAEYHKNKNLFIENPTMEDIYNKFLPTKKNRSEDTIAMYKTSWTYFEDIKDEPISEIKSYHIQDIVNNLIDEEKSYSTVHKVKTLASQLYKIAMEDDFVNKNYAQFVTLPKKPKPDNRVFSDEEVEQLFKCAKNNYWAKVIIVMIFTAMRPNELLKTTKFNVHLKDDYIIAGGKTEAGTDRYIPIYSRIKPVIKELYNLSDTEYLISYNGSKVNYRFYLDKHYEVINYLNIQELSPHKCRKTGATFYQKHGMDRTTLQRMLGHKDYKTTDQFYIGDIQKEMQKAMESI